MQFVQLQHAIALLAVCGLGAGCTSLNSSSTSSESLQSISTSLQSISNSVQSSSTSSSGNDGGVAAAYGRDVRNFTAAFVDSDASRDEFLRNLGRIAEAHGITHWERERETYVAVGAGLRQAGVDRAALRAFQESLAGADPAVVESLLEGYDS